MSYITLIELYLTFLTHNDSYMEKIPVGSILSVIKGDIYFHEKCSIDDLSDFLHYKYIEEYHELH